MLVTREERMLVESISCALTFSPQALPPGLARPLLHTSRYRQITGVYPLPV